MRLRRVGRAAGEDSDIRRIGGKELRGADSGKPRFKEIGEKIPN